MSTAVLEITSELAHLGGSIFAEKHYMRYVIGGVCVAKEIYRTYDDSNTIIEFYQQHPHLKVAPLLRRYK